MLITMTVCFLYFPDFLPLFIHFFNFLSSSILFFSYTGYLSYSGFPNILSSSYTFSLLFLLSYPSHPIYTPSLSFFPSFSLSSHHLASPSPFSFYSSFLSLLLFSITSIFITLAYLSSFRTSFPSSSPHLFPPSGPLLKSYPSSVSYPTSYTLKIPIQNLFFTLHP